MKKDTHPAHIVIKLLMNAMYAKTIIKLVETDTIVNDNKDDFGKYTPYKYKSIDSVVEVNGIYYIKQVINFITL